MHIQSVSSPQFTGFFNSENFKMSKREKRGLIRTIHRNTNIPYDTLEIEGMTKFSNKHRLRFLEKLSDRYLSEHFTNPERINQKDVITTYKSVKNPTDVHEEILELMNIKEAQMLFRVIESHNSVKALEKLCNLSSTFRKTEQGLKLYKNAIIQLAVSSQAEEINKNFEIYEPYIKLHHNEKNMIQHLEENIINKTYDGEAVATEYKIHKIKQTYPILENIYIDKETIDNKDKKQLLRAIGSTFTTIQYFTHNRKNLSLDNETIHDILDSTTRKNSNFRIKFLKQLRHADKNIQQKVTLENINEIFNLTDTYPSKYQSEILEEINYYGFPDNLDFSHILPENKKKNNFIQQIFSK